VNNNDILIRLRYALNITDVKAMELFRLAGRDMGRPELESLFKREDEEGYVECDDSAMRSFLEGLIISRRGKRDDEKAQEPRGSAHLSNNDILKSLRVALSLKDGDLIEILRLAGVEVSKSELTALFRKYGHPNYRPCGDQFLRNFLAGLTAKYRV
jgi:uncharacterized protein YehS (DUF1456 family)